MADLFFHVLGIHYYEVGHTKKGSANALPDETSHFLMMHHQMNQWQGPFLITEKITEVTYKVYLGTKTKQYRTFHVNCMRPWIFPVSAVFLAQKADEEDLESGKKKPTQVISDSHSMDLEKLKTNSDVLQDIPGRTTLLQHDIPR